MPFTKQGPYTVGGAFSSANANNIETQYDEATQSLGQDEMGAFVYTGGVCTIHGGLPKQLDYTATVIYVKQADNTLRRRSISASFVTTVTISTTYFLYFQPDGTVYWSTVNSPAANSLAIATVTTDGSGNINVITDARATNFDQFTSAVGRAKLGGKFIILQGTHSGVSFTLSAGNGAPGTLDTNEIYFQLT